MRRTIFTMLALAAAASPGAALAQYDYVGPVVARDSGLSCIGTTVTNENRIVRNEFFGLFNNNSTNTLTVLCPLNRRNVSAYGDSSAADRFLMENLTIFVHNRSTSSAIECQAFAWSARFASARTTSFVKATGTGHTTISFTNPFGTTAIDGEGTVNIGYQCRIPGGGTFPNKNILIGAEAQFRSQS
jgi:hypothetical protein